MNLDLVKAFEDGSLNLREFDHKKHIYVAWVYLRIMPFQEALDRYVSNLKFILEKAGYLWKFSLPITESYFHKIDDAIKQNPSSMFEQVVDKIK